MEWGPAQKYFQQSSDGRYSVSAARIASGIVYTAWRCDKPYATPVGNRDDASACRQICEADRVARSLTEDIEAQTQNSAVA